MRRARYRDLKFSTDRAAALVECDGEVENFHERRRQLPAGHSTKRSAMVRDATACDA
jgi:hypothetical protein